MSNNKLHAIGIMSGTSLDGIEFHTLVLMEKADLLIIAHLYLSLGSTRKSLHALVKTLQKIKIAYQI